MNVSRRTELAGDDGGAIMVIAVFKAVFLVGVLYYVIGVGQTILDVERLQDASDAAALSSAIVQARGMNFIVLLNIVMAALLAILVALKVVESVTIIAMGIAAGAAFFTGGASLALIPPLKLIQHEVRTAYESTQKPVYQALEILHDGADYLVAYTPQVANEIARNDAPKDLGVAIYPLEQTLPLEDDSFDRLCEEAGHIAADVATIQFEFVKLGFVRKPIRSAVGALAKSFSDWFCGDSGGPPSHTQKIWVSYPNDGRSDDPAQACPGEPEATDVPELAFSAECNEIQKRKAQAVPDRKTGECRPETDCSLDGPYEQNVTKAREQCNPKTVDEMHSYSYQIRKGHVVYTLTRKGWERGEPVYEDLRLVNYPKQLDTAASKDEDDPDKPKKVNPPCGTKRATYSGGYNLQVHPEEDSSLVLPICSDEEPPSRLERWRTNIEQRVDFTEVTHIFGCTREEDKRHDFDMDQVENSSGGERHPKRVMKSFKMGSEAFQTRAFVHASGTNRLVDSGARLPLWGRMEPENPSLAPLRVGQQALTQAEFYFNGTDKGQWMWKMSWRARLRLFRSFGRDLGAIRNELNEQLSAEETDDIMTVLDSYGGLIFH